MLFTVRVAQDSAALDGSELMVILIILVIYQALVLEMKSEWNTI